jgi:hypothetical protein
MSAQATHPLFDLRFDDWILLGDAHEGERQVKAKADAYLLPTRAMRDNGFGKGTGLGNTSPGQAAYDAYKARAVFPDDLRKAVAGMVGVIHHKPPTVSVPKALEPMVESMSVDGESLELLWQKVTMAQLLFGRCGLLVDVPDRALAGDAIPYAALYAATAVRNWDAGRPTAAAARRKLRFVTLDESAVELQPDMSWRYVQRYRICAMAEALGVPELSGYVTALLEQDQEVDTAEWVQPKVAAPLAEVPFVFVNPTDLVPEPDVPPLLGLATLSMAVYRGEADYRQGLHLQSQDTLVRIGGDPEVTEVELGAGAVIDVPAGGDAKFIGISATGLPEQRQCLENDRKKLGEQSMEGLDAGTGSSDQSGEALRVRAAARTATLTRLQHAAAGAIRDCLVHAGRFLGLSDSELDQIEVTPNLDFSSQKALPIDVSNLMDAKTKGAPLSRESIHTWLRENEYTDKTFDEEQELLDEESAQADARAKATAASASPPAVPPAPKPGA